MRRAAECGRIAPGFRADLAIWGMPGVEAAGSWDAAALLLAGPTRVRNLIVEGAASLRLACSRPSTWSWSCGVSVPLPRHWLWINDFKNTIHYHEIGGLKAKYL